mgnify:CR=1 FL=1
MSARANVTVKRWLSIWLETVPEAELGWALKRRFTSFVTSELGDFGATLLSEVRLADAYRFSRRLPKGWRDAAYDFLDYGLRAAKRAAAASILFRTMSLPSFGFFSNHSVKASFTHFWVNVFASVLPNLVLV